VEGRAELFMIVRKGENSAVVDSERFRGFSKQRDNGSRNKGEPEVLLVSFRLLPVGPVSALPPHAQPWKDDQWHLPRYYS
jgi:hypothetical protein